MEFTEHIHCGAPPQDEALVGACRNQPALGPWKVKDDVKFDLNKLAAGEMFCVNCSLGRTGGFLSKNHRGCSATHFLGNLKTRGVEKTGD